MSFYFPCMCFSMLLGQVYAPAPVFSFGIILVFAYLNLTVATPVKTSPCAGLGNKEVTAAEFYFSVGWNGKISLKQHLNLTCEITAGSNKLFLKFMFQNSSLLLVNNGKTWNAYLEEFQKALQIQAKKKRLHGLKQLNHKPGAMMFPSWPLNSSPPLKMGHGPAAVSHAMFTVSELPLPWTQSMKKSRPLSAPQWPCWDRPPIKTRWETNTHTS